MRWTAHGLLSARTLALALCVAAPLVTASPPTAAAAPPPSPRFAASIDPYAGYDAQDQCLAVEQPGVKDFRAMVLKAYPGVGSSGPLLRACNVGGVTEHKEGRAWDWMVKVSDPKQRAAGYELTNWLLATDAHGNRHAMARRLGVMYVMFDNRIWGSYAAGAGWKPQMLTVNGVKRDCATLPSTYTTACHRDHVHTSFSWAGATRKTSWWAKPPALLMESAPTVGGNGSAQIVVAQRLADASIGVRSWSAEQGMGSTQQLNAVASGSPAVMRRGAATEVVVRGEDGRTLWAKHDATGTWGARWTTLGDSRARPAAATTPDGRAVLVAAGTDGALWLRATTVPGSWAPRWQRLGGSVDPTSGPAATYRPDGSLEIAYLDPAGTVNALTVRDGAPTDWRSLGGAAVGDVALVVDAAGTPHVVVRGTNDAGFAKPTTATATARWTALGGVLATSPSAAAQDAPTSSVWIRGTNGLIYRIQYDGRWGSWTRVSE